MKKLLLSFVFLFLWSFGVKAQETEFPKASHTNKRYLGAIELGFLYQKNQAEETYFANSVSNPSLTIFNGYALHRLFAVGATVGADFYNAMLVTPVALGVRGTFLPTKVSPYYSLDTGYGFTFLNEESGSFSHEGGWMVNPGLGLKVTTGNNTAFIFHAGYKMQKAASETNFWGTTTLQKTTFKRLSVRIGFEF